MSGEEQTIRRLNAEYIRAFLESDVDWYDGHLADDFRFINGAGAIIDRPAFLRLAAFPPGVVDYKLHDVTVRMHDDTAFVQARGEFTRADGTQGRNRYTDVYIRSNGDWKAVSAQVTPIVSTR